PGRAGVAARLHRRGPGRLGAAAGTTVSALSSANSAVTLFFVLKAATPL
ncbi:hypothetical protein GA0115241_108112, partial [Streptomyces sp. DpondAA-D4]